MKLIQHTIAVGLVFAFAGCGKSEPRSQTYFASHPDEARVIVAGCRKGTVRGGECDIADHVVQEADAKARLKRFFGS